MSQENVEVVERAIVAVNARDIEAYLACCTQDIELHTPVVAVAGVYEGAAGIRRFFADVEDAAPDFRLDLESVRAIGADQVLAFLNITASGRVSGLPTGTPTRERLRACQRQDQACPDLRRSSGSPRSRGVAGVVKRLQQMGNYEPAIPPTRQQEATRRLAHWTVGVLGRPGPISFDVTLVGARRYDRGTGKCTNSSARAAGVVTTAPHRTIHRTTPAPPAAERSSEQASKDTSAPDLHSVHGSRAPARRFPAMTPGVCPRAVLSLHMKRAP
jgi:hypothetical protein